MKRYIFYPILFAITSILLLYVVNTNEIPISQLFPIIIIAPTVSAIIIWLFSRFSHNFHRAGYIVFLLTCWFFYYGVFRLFITSYVSFPEFFFEDHLIFLPLWSIIFLLLGSRQLWRKIDRPETITLYLNVFGIAVFCFSLYKISTILITQYQTNQVFKGYSQSVPEMAKLSNLPDFYYIILDGYAREDVLYKLYNYDNSEFIKALETRGFFVASQSQSNYSQTLLSLASSFNMEYLGDLPVGSNYNGPLLAMIQENKIHTILKRLGYTTVSFYSGFIPQNVINVDKYYSPASFTESKKLEALIFIISPLILFGENAWYDVTLPHFRDQQNVINYTLETISTLSANHNSPIFVNIHLTIPHPPFIFNETGPINPNDFYSLVDGNKLPGGTEAYIRGYLSQLDYLNTHLLLAIDGIIANAESAPIIILQSDHGPGAFMDWHSVENTCLKERLSILNAFYLPQEIPINVPSDITSINTFPFILNSFFGMHFDILENKNYFSTKENPYNFIDVTDISQRHCDIQ